jgi:hypothetical protein
METHAEPDQVAYFLSHDDDVARELESLAEEPEEDLRAPLDVEDFAEEVELLAELRMGGQDEG